VCGVLAVVIARPSASFGSTTPRCSTSNLILGFVRQMGALGTTVVLHPWQRAYFTLTFMVRFPYVVVGSELQLRCSWS